MLRSMEIQIEFGAMPSFSALRALWCIMISGPQISTRVCAGLKEGRHPMRVAAVMVVFLFTAQLEEGIYPVWSCC